MPMDQWATQPSITRHGFGYSIPVGVTETGDGSEEHPKAWVGLRLHVPALSSVDIIHAAAQDADATPDHVTEALAVVLDVVAPSLQEQIDQLTDTVLMGAS